MILSILVKIAQSCCIESAPHACSIMVKHSCIEFSKVVPIGFDEIPDDVGNVRRQIDLLHLHAHAAVIKHLRVEIVLSHSQCLWLDCRYAQLRLP